MNGSFSRVFPDSCLYCAYHIESRGLNLGKFTVSNPSGRETAGIRNLETHPTEMYTAMCRDRIQGFVWESRV